MRTAAAVALALLAAAAAPANATVGLLCKGPGGSRPWISLIFGAGPDGGIAGAALRENAVWLSTMNRPRHLVLREARANRRRVFVRLVDRRGRAVARLRARFTPGGHGAAVGDLTVRGKTRKVRCMQD